MPISGSYSTDDVQLHPREFCSFQMNTIVTLGCSPAHVCFVVLIHDSNGTSGSRISSGFSGVLLPSSICSALLWRPCKLLLLLTPFHPHKSHVNFEFFFPRFRCVQLWWGLPVHQLPGKINIFCIDFLHIRLDWVRTLKVGTSCCMDKTLGVSFGLYFGSLVPMWIKKYISSYLNLTICGACNQGRQIPKSPLKLETIFEDLV
jgi:hypothetical protein